MKPALHPTLRISALSVALLFPVLSGAVACGDEAALPPGSGTSGAQTTGGSTVVPTGGTAGTVAAGGSDATAGTGVGTGGTGTGGTGTPGAGTGPMAGTGTVAGSSGSAPMGGTGGTGTAGTSSGGGGSGGGAPDLVATVGGPLSGAMLLGKCLNDTAASVCQTFAGGCPGANQADPALSGAITTDKMITLGGDPNVTYTITLHVQGEAESKRYTGGQDQNSTAQSPKADGFCVGGTPTNGDAYNVYMVRVDSPKQDYFLNSMAPPGISNHTTYGLDYTAKIQAKGGAKLRLVAADSNCSMIKNCGPQENNGNVCSAPIILQNMDPKAVSLNPTFDFTKAYNGQWLVMVVTDVTAN